MGGATVDYKVITEDGIEITIESNNPSESKKRLAAYYITTEEAKVLDDYCKRKKCSKAGFIRQAIKEKMEKEP